MQKRKLAAVWIESHRRWQLKIQRDGVRRTFYSSIPGKRGKSECERKAALWADGFCNSPMKLGALWKLFLVDQEARTGTGNYTNMESIGRTWILPKLAHKRVENITEQDFQNILNSAAMKGRSKKTISNIRGAFTAFLRFARKNRATDLRADDLVIPHRAPIGKRTVLEGRDLSILFTSTKTMHRQKVIDEWYIHAFRFLASAGLRPGELCELKEREQTSTKSLSVTGSLNRFGEHTSGKTANAIRTFVLPTIALQIIGDQKAMLKAAGIVSPYLFPAPDGNQSTSALLYKHWIKYQKFNDLPGISLYELRHTFVSVCKGNVPEPLIKPIIGHSSDMPSYKTYGHAMSGELEMVAKMIDSAYAEIGAKK